MTHKKINLSKRINLGKKIDGQKLKELLEIMEIDQEQLNDSFPKNLSTIFEWGRYTIRTEKNYSHIGLDLYRLCKNHGVSFVRQFSTEIPTEEFNQRNVSDYIY